ncbi:integrase core domain protein [Lasius niger]|uniref:Integrase core domain protein n=1 Tax=Lasius niger TaxID=67767 RepID=A0A0J7K717_LASNI|nr:integrase core domain protein [Lasius niger]
MDGDKVKIEKLTDSSNWMQWKFQVRAILDARDALEVIDGSLVKPEGENPEDAAELNRWKKANKAANAILVTTLNKKPLSLVMTCETARDMWVKLLNIYEQKYADSVYLLQTQFREYRYNSGDDIATHVSRLESFARRLQKLNEPISDTMLMTTVLNTLPPAFRHFHSAWDSTPAAKRTLDKLISRLMVEEIRLGINDISMRAESALISKKQIKGGNTTQRTHKKDKADSSKIKIKCWTCGGPHLRRDCPEKKKDGNSQDKQKEKTHGLAMVSTRFSNTFDATKWIIDSGCTEHVCWQIECFINYEKLKKSVTFELGDGRKVSAEGSGQIRIRSHVDGKEHYFQNVMFVPEMKANLFSVRSVAEKGFRQTIVDDKWVFKKNGLLVIEGHRTNEMYILDIDVIHNQEYSFVARNRKEDSLQVWHERMGHQSKAHVKELLTSKGIEVSSLDRTEYCDGCSFGKCQRTNFREMPKAIKEGEL